MWLCFEQALVMFQTCAGCVWRCTRPGGQSGGRPKPGGGRPQSAVPALHQLLSWPGKPHHQDGGIQRHTLAFLLYFVARTLVFLS